MNQDRCPFKHDNIDTLYGVIPIPIEGLPQVCTCGAPLTYADDVAFVNQVTPEVPPDEVVVTTLVPRMCPRCQSLVLKDEAIGTDACTRCTWPNPSFTQMRTTLARKGVNAQGYDMTDQALEDFAASRKSETTLIDPQGRSLRAKVFEVHVHDGQVDVTFEFDPKGWQVPQ